MEFQLPTKKRKAKNPRVIRNFFIEDSGKNFVQMHSNDKTCVLFLKLASEQRKRKIGVITKSTKTIKMERDREKHLFIKGNSYGFNNYILETAKTFDKISLTDGIDDWKIPVSFILEHGKFLYFSEQGFEKQRFVSLSELEPYRVKKEENRRF